MNPYLMERLAADRRRDLDREAAASRLAATARERRRGGALPPVTRGVRERMALRLGRALAGGGRASA